MSEYEVVIFNPRRNDWDASWENNIQNEIFVKQVQWEINHIQAADLVIFYIQGGTMSPITLYELGLVSKDAAAKNKNVIVYCEESFWRKGNVDVVCSMFSIDSVTTFDELKSSIVTWLNARVIDN